MGIAGVFGQTDTLLCGFALRPVGKPSNISFGLHNASDKNYVLGALSARVGWSVLIV
jgi:hypothetical protein